jgi:SAM-dependent methyltransferase
MTNQPEQIRGMFDQWSATRGPARPAPGEEPAPGRILDIAQGYVGAKLLFVAVDVGLFEALATGAATVEELARRCGLPARTTRVVVDGLVLWGLLERDGAHYRATADAATFLTGQGPLDVRPLLRAFDKLNYPAWLDATQVVRTGQVMRGRLDAAETELYESAVSFLTSPAAVALPDVYDFGRHRRLLDVGGGIGMFLTRILTRHTQVDGTLLELPDVAEMAVGKLADSPVADRIEVVGADMFGDPLPDGHDAILLSHVVHLFPPEPNLALLRRLREAMAPDGRLLILDWFVGAEVRPSIALISAEWLMLGGGCAYRADEVIGWLQETGWRLAEHVPLFGPMSVLVAEPV